MALEIPSQLVHCQDNNLVLFLVQEGYVAVCVCVLVNWASVTGFSGMFIFLSMDLHYKKRVFKHL